MIGISATPRASKLACPAAADVGKRKARAGLAPLAFDLKPTKTIVEALSDAALRLRKTSFVIDGKPSCSGLTAFRIRTVCRAVGATRMCADVRTMTMGQLRESVYRWLPLLGRPGCCTKGGMSREHCS